MRQLRDKLPNLPNLPGLPAGIGDLPVLTLALAVTWLIAGLVVQLGYSGQLEQARIDLRTAAEYAINDPVVKVDQRFLPVVRDVMPTFENDTVLGFMRKKDARKAQSVQDEFDGLVTQAFASLEVHPFRTLGVVPGQFKPHTLATYHLIHSGWLYLAGTLLLFMLAAPLLEEKWGHAGFGLAAVAIMLLGASAYCLVHMRSDHALVGGSTLIAGLVAAAVSRFRDEEVDFLGWLEPIVRVELSAPAWMLAIPWALYEISLFWSVPEGLPNGVDNGVGITAHASALVVGAALPVAFGALGWDEVPAAKPAVAKPEKKGAANKSKAARVDMAKVAEAREQGEHPVALDLLEPEVARNPGNRGIVKLYWEVALEGGIPEAAAPAMTRLIHEELRRNAESVAVGIWRALSDGAPASFLDPELLVRLAPMIARHEDAKGAEQALAQALDARNPTRLQAALAVEIARLAMELQPEFAYTAAQVALADDSITEMQRAELQLLVGELAPEEPKFVQESKEAAPSAFFEESDRSAFGDVGDLSAISDSFPEGAITDATPLAMENVGLRVKMAGGDESRIDYSRLQAVCVAGIHGLGPKPVMLVDMLVDGAGFDGPLNVIRLRSDQFDPRQLMEGAETGIDAMRKLIAHLVAQGDAKALPDPEGAAANPVRVFESLDAYHTMLREKAGELA